MNRGRDLPLYRQVLALPTELLLERLIVIVINCLFFQMFPGNSDRNTVVYNRLYPSFKGRFVRIYPKQWHGHISMRVELYGCNSGKWSW